MLERRERALWCLAGLSLAAAGMCFLWVKLIGPLPGELRFEAWRVSGDVPGAWARPSTFITNLGSTWVAVATVFVFAAVFAEQRGPYWAGLTLAAAAVVVFVAALRPILGPTSPAYGDAPGTNLGLAANFPSVHTAYAVSVFGVVSWFALETAIERCLAPGPPRSPDGPRSRPPGRPLSR